MDRIIDANGQERYTGCLPRVQAPNADRFPIVGVTDGTLEIIPRNLWTPTTMRHHVFHIYDQGQQNSCCATAGCGLMSTWRKAQGLKERIFSQAYTYHYGNGGRDQGMAVDSLFEILKTRGTVTTDVIDQYDWQGRRWPNNADELAKRYVLDEGWDCPNIEALGTILEQGHIAEIGVFWDYPRQRGGHAIYVVGKEPVGNGHWKWEIVNSWKNYGEHAPGMGYLSEAQVEQGIEVFGAFVPRLQHIQDDDPMPLSVK